MAKYRKSKLPSLCLHKPSGQGYVTDPRDKRVVYLGRHSTADCERAYREWIAEYIKATGRTASRADAPASLGGLMTIWLAEMDKKCRKVTGKHTGEYSVCDRAHSLVGEVGLEGLPLKDLNRNHIYQIRDHLLAKGSARKTIHEYVRRIIRACSFAENREWLDTNQFLRLSRWEKLRPGDAPPPKELEAAGEYHLKRMFLKLPVKWRPIFILHLFSGCRTENALAIRAEEIDCSKKPWVFKPVQHKGRHRGHSLEIMLGPKCREALKPFIKETSSGNLWRKKGEIMHQTYRKAFARACEAAGVPNISPRQIRHTAASFLVNNGVPESVIASILGHRPGTITQRYAKVEDKARAKVVEKFG